MQGKLEGYVIYLKDHMWPCRNRTFFACIIAVTDTPRHTHRHAYTQTHTHTHTNTCTCVRRYVCHNTHTHTHTQTYTHTHTHTHTRTNTHTQPGQAHFSESITLSAPRIGTIYCPTQRWRERESIRAKTHSCRAELGTFDIFGIKT